MPRLSTAIDRANPILRAHGTPFRLREGHGSRWLSIDENCPGPRVRSCRSHGGGPGSAAQADDIQAPGGSCTSWGTVMNRRGGGRWMSPRT